MNDFAEKQKTMFGILINAMYSNNKDYILSQLSRIYTIIYSNNIGLTEFKRLEEKELCDSVIQE